MESDNEVKCYLQSWTRVQDVLSVRGQPLLDQACETGNYKIINSMFHHRHTNELVQLCMTLDVECVKQFFSKLKFDESADLRAKDTSCHPARSVTADLLETYGEERSADMIRFLVAEGAEPPTDYLNKRLVYLGQFQRTRLFRLIYSLNSLEMVQEAWSEIHQNAKHVLPLRLAQLDFTFLHLAVLKYHCLTDKVLKSGLIRLMYKMALEDVDLQACDCFGRTALVLAATRPDHLPLDSLAELAKQATLTRCRTAQATNDVISQKDEAEDETCMDHNSYDPPEGAERPQSAGFEPRTVPENFHESIPDQNLLQHLLRIGLDSSIGTRNGLFVAREMYLPRGALRLLSFKRSVREQDRISRLPGIWPALDAALKEALSGVARGLSYARLSDELKKHAVRIQSNRRNLNALAYVRSHLDEKVAANPPMHAALKQLMDLLLEWLTRTEFVASCLAGDIVRMKQCLASGAGAYKCCMQLQSHCQGLTEDRLAVQYITRPIMVHAMEMCPTAVVEVLINYGADLEKVYAEHDFQGPLAFWACQPHVPLATLAIILEHDEVHRMRDARGRSLLLGVAERFRWNVEQQGARKMTEADRKWFFLCTASLLENDCNFALRDADGFTARDIALLPAGEELRQLVNRFDQAVERYGYSKPSTEEPGMNTLSLLDNVSDDMSIADLIDRKLSHMHFADELELIEQLILDGYDALAEANTKWPRFQSGEHLAEMCGHKDLLRLLTSAAEYRSDMADLHDAVRRGDLAVFTRLSSERRLSLSNDWRGRSLLHLAVLMDHRRLAEVVAETAPQLILHRDYCGRTPLHYCMLLPRDQRYLVNQLLQYSLHTVDLTELRDAFGRSVLDYSMLRFTGQLDCSTLLKLERDLPYIEPGWRDKFNRGMLSLTDRKKSIIAIHEELRKVSCPGNLQLSHSKTRSRPTEQYAAVMFPVPGAYYHEQARSHRRK